MEKRGDLNPDKGKSDFNTKTAAFYDEDGFGVADQANKGKLKNPKPIKKNK